MKKIVDPLSFERVKGIIKNKIINKKILLVMVPFITLASNFCDVIYEQDIFNKMNMTFYEDRTVEYGSEFIGIDFVDNLLYGKITYNSTVDTTKLGEHEVMYIMSDGYIDKEFYTTVSVIDTKSPDINLDKDNVSIYVGNDYDVNSNIVSVIDNVDGELSYKSGDISDDDKGYYTITTNFDKDVAGDYIVDIKAVDLSGNISNKSYNINVKKEVKYFYSYVNYNVSASVDTTSIVSAAYSFLGYRYTPGGASPETGFDCTGFVYYLYGLFGKTVGRSSSDIVYSGTGVSRDNISAGDIIVFSTMSNNYPTHAALYVGDGMMIHAANSNDGVIISSVSDWESWGAHIVAIRRV